MEKTRKITAILVLAVVLFLNLTSSATAQSKTSKADCASVFRKGPYLIFEGDNTKMRVLWQLVEDIPATIKWGLDTSYALGSGKTAEYGKDHQHAFIITGLKPGAKYFYLITAAKTDSTGSFFTAPPEDATKVNFFAYGDMRSHPDVHDSVVKAMLATSKADPAFQTITISTGDLVKFGAVETQWDDQLFNCNFKNIQNMLATIPLVSSPGNHEVFKMDYKGKDLKMSLFRKYFPYPYVKDGYWSFDYGPIHFAMLNQFTKGHKGDIIPKKQLKWLEQDLKTSKKLWKFIVVHVPGWSALNDKHHWNSKAVQERIQPLMEKYEVAALFAGHNHMYARAVVNGIQHITTAGGGAKLHKPDPSMENIVKAFMTHHFCKVEIDGNTLRFTAVKPDGTVIDSFTLKK